MGSCKEKERMGWRLFLAQSKACISDPSVADTTPPAIAANSGAPKGGGPADGQLPNGNM